MSTELEFNHSRIETEPEPTVYIVRGISGSGKSTFSEWLKGKEGEIVSNDDYFTDPEGVYKFDHTKITEAVSYSQKKFLDLLSEGRAPIVVDNTNKQARDYEFYKKEAANHGYRVEIVDMPKPNTEDAAARNIHGVPITTIRNQAQRWESDSDSITPDQLLEKLASES